MDNTDADTNVPRGYARDARGNFVPIAKIKDVDKDRDATVIALCEQAKAASAALLAFKLEAGHTVAEFVGRSLADYGVKTGGGKGNVTLHSYDGKYKVQRQMQEQITFDERLQAAKALIDACITAWSKGSNANIKALINNAFQVDSAGKISVSRVLGLRQIKIDDPQWLEAMQAIADSTQVVSSKQYIRFYELNETTGEYVPIVLDVAGA
jgi:hypothetical protein